MLANFRDWLGQLSEVPDPCDEPQGVDLCDLVSQFTALRHEVNLQTKASRTSVEQHGETLRNLGSAIRQLDERPKDDPVLNVLIKCVLDVYDNLSMAVRQVEKNRASLEPALESLNEVGDVSEPPILSAVGPDLVVERPRGFWSRLFGSRMQAAAPSEFADAVGRQMMIDWRAIVLKDAESRRDCLSELGNQVRSSVDALIVGYRMSINRIDRVLNQVELEPIPAEGMPFDPELMEALEVVPAGPNEPGIVVEEVRRGYRWRGSVFRYAQVKVGR